MSLSVAFEVIFLGYVQHGYLLCSIVVWMTMVVIPLFWQRFGERAKDQLAVRAGKWWSGGKNMKDSSAYTNTFGSAVPVFQISCWECYYYL